jgi:hypothetical protein
MGFYRDIEALKSSAHQRALGVLAGGRQRLFRGLTRQFGAGCAQPGRCVLGGCADMRRALAGRLARLSGRPAS